MVKSLRFGRGQNNDVVINDPAVSEFHCKITLDDNGNFYITDFNTTNGTFINETKVHGSAWLRRTDVVRIGSTTLSWLNHFTPTPTNQYTQQSPNIPSPNNSYQNNPQQKVSFRDNSTRFNKPESHLAGAIIVTLLCCWPFGIPAIVNASKVDQYWSMQKYDEAWEYSNKAKNWIIVSFILGLFAGVIIFLTHNA